MSKKIHKSNIGCLENMSFADAMSDVKRLKHNFELYDKPKPKPVVKQWIKDDTIHCSLIADEDIVSMSQMEGVKRLKENNQVIHTRLSATHFLDAYDKYSKPSTEALEQRDDLSFSTLMKGVKPLASQSIVHHNNPKPPPILCRLDKDDRVIEKATIELSDTYELADIQPEEIMSFRREGVQKTTFKRLRAGHYRIVDELDLHGMTSTQAREVLADFLQDAKQFDNTCVKVIHGKGMRSSSKVPILKRKVDSWLRCYDRVLAFHSTLPVDGGTGALYLLLKKMPRK